MTAAGGYEFLVALLLIILILELVARRLHLPPAALFIVGGAALALAPGVPTLSFPPDLVLIVFLPPLLMNGGYFTVWAEFRQNLAAISLLAVGAVIFTTAAVGAAAHTLMPYLPWAVCFALGAIVSPPDAVAAAAVLKRLSLPSRLTATLEGESLLNDASGLVLFRFAVAAALTGAFDLAQAVGSFVLVSAGGLVLGLCAGRLGVAVLRRLPDSELSIIVTLLLPVASYGLGERLGVSGVLATVAAGVVLGRAQHSAMSALTRVRVQGFWQAYTFLLESLLFILVGLQLREVAQRIRADPGSWHALWPAVAAVVAATIIARIAWVYATWLMRRTARALGAVDMPRPSLRFATVLGWAGMRGAVTLAAALSLPKTIAGRDFVLVSAFAVILVTVLGQGVTLGPLIRLLGLNGQDEANVRQAKAEEARADIAEAQLLAVRSLSHQDEGGERHPQLVESYARRAELARDALTDRETHAHHRLEHHQALLEIIRAGRAEALRLHAGGSIHDDDLRAFERDFDLQEIMAEARGEEATAVLR